MQKVASNRMEFTQPRQTGGCCWGGCVELGKFPAPKASVGSKEQYHFCLEHIRTYNNAWDFFDKMDRKQIERLQEEMLLNNRPTWKFGVQAANLDYIEEVQNRVFNEFRGTSKHQHTQNAAGRALPKPVRDALRVLGLQYPISMQDVKKQYKSLAKAHHPDLKKGSDERIKAINNAYHVLKNSDCLGIQGKGC